MLKATLECGIGRKDRKKGYVCACGYLKVEEFKKIQYQQDKVDGHLVIIDGMT